VRRRRPGSGWLEDRAETFRQILCLVGFSYFFLLAQPGSLSPDSINQWRQARENIYADFHPPIMSFVWHFLDRIAVGPAGMLYLQLALFWTALYFFSKYLRGSTLLSFAIIPLLAFWPSLVGTFTVIWKDLQMNAALFLAVALGLHYRQNRKVSYLLGSLAGLFYGVAVRHNAIAAAVPMGLLYLRPEHVRRLPEWMRKPSLVIGSVLIAVTVFAAVQGSSRLLAKRGPSNIATYFKVWDIVAIAHYDNVDISKMNVGTGIPMTREWVEAGYDPSMMVPLLGVLCIPKTKRCEVPYSPQKYSAEEVHALNVLWLGLVREHPHAYLKHRWGFFKHLIGTHERKLWAPVFFGIEGLTNEKEMPQIEYHLSPHARAIIDWVNTYQSTLVFRVWFYLLILLGCTVYGTWDFIRRNRPEFLVLGVSGILYSFSYFFVAVSSDFRYSLWTILIALLGAALALDRAIQFARTRKI